MRISKPTIFLAIFIVISASFMRQILDFINNLLGKDTVIVLFAVVQIVGGSFFLHFLVNKNLGSKKLIVIFFVLFLGMFLIWKIKIFAERVHILEYGVLGYLAARDERVSKFNIKGVYALLFTACVGGVDELFQGILPYRYFDVRDIVFNCLGAAWGIIIYILEKR